MSSSSEMVLKDASITMTNLDEGNTRPVEFTGSCCSQNNDLNYPNASTISFPYPHLYPQQRDLINTLLKSLQMIHQRDINNTSSSSASPSSSSSSLFVATSNPANSTSPSTITDKCCPVYMLESPTGTGKSLSLACSAIAWLRFMEQYDMNINTTNNQSHTESTTTKIGTTPSNVVTQHDVDWVQDYVSINERQQIEQRLKMIQQAKESRQLLQTALQEINNQHRDNTKGDILQQNEQQRRVKRQQIVRQAVLDAKQEWYNNDMYKHRRRQRSILHKKQMKRQNGNDENIHHDESIEFVLDQYQSDDNDDKMKDNDSIQNINDNYFSDDEIQNHSLKSFSVLRQQQPKVIKKAPQLLHGHALDGSKAYQNSYNSNNTQKAVGDVKPGSGVRKIIYTARTHTQLSQFVREVKRCCNDNNTIRVIHLGGRNNLCTNPTIVQQKSSERAITEACLDLQKGVGPDVTNKSNNDNTNKKRTINNSSIRGCPMLEGRDVTIPTLALHMQTEPTDIEEAVQMGTISNTCAYYASRAALAAAEIVVLPYSMLLSKSTRESIGLSLKQALVIVDEAHNVPEALRSIHTCQLSLPIINTALQQLSWYTQRYSNCMAGRNLLYLGQIRKILLSFQKHLNKSPTIIQSNRMNESNCTSKFNHPTNSNNVNSGMITATELLIDRKLDNINLYQLLRFLERSRLSQKLLGYTNYKAKIEAAQKDPNQMHNENLSNDGLSKHISSMSIVETFLEKLAFHGTDGKIMIDWPTDTKISVVGDSDSQDRSSKTKYPSYRYVLLQPASFFQNVLEEAYALALVGGTLRPFVHVVAELLGDQGGTTILCDAAKADTIASLSSHQVSNSFITPNFTAFTCDHVVPPTNTLLQCIGRGPTNTILDFRYQSRSNKDVCIELGRTILEICRNVPNGVVIFLPSYSYEAFLIRHWKLSGLWNELQSIKSVHREPKSSQYVEASLQSYANDAVQGPSGAILFSVIGGKMSEGINFSDDMARCVVVVGLPYPDNTDPVLIEKMVALNNLQTNNAISGQSYYQNLCLRAVSQSVGRAIRHANDYASIILIDHRYTTDSRVWSGLPNWLKKQRNANWHDDIPFAQRIIEIKDFFVTKNPALS